MMANLLTPFAAEAAELISEALRFEAEEQFEASLGAYRSGAVGAGMLTPESTTSQVSHRQAAQFSAD